MPLSLQQNDEASANARSVMTRPGAVKPVQIPGFGVFSIWQGGCYIRSVREQGKEVRDERLQDVSHELPSRKKGTTYGCDSAIYVHLRDSEKDEQSLGSCEDDADPISGFALERQACGRRRHHRSLRGGLCGRLAQPLTWEWIVCEDSST
jgi:hypothetical protein